MTPLAWIYYAWCLLPSLAAVLVRHARSGGATLVRVAALGLLVPLPLVASAAGWGNGMATATVASIYTWALILLWLGASMPATEVTPRSSGVAA
jgi:hypothetical protein